MNMMAPVQFDILDHANSYMYDKTLFEPLYARLVQKMLAYDSDFGPYLVGHLDRVAHHTEQFMLAEGYGADVARKVADATRLHDIGKILQSPSLWRITEDKRTPEERAERKKHGALGKNVLRETIAELRQEGINIVHDEDARAHIELIEYVQDAHHERLNGNGPLKMMGPQLDNVIRIIAIADTLDGKAKDPAKTLSGIFDEMAGVDERQKHIGEFDLPLVARFNAYYSQSLGSPPSAALANQANY